MPPGTASHPPPSARTSPGCRWAPPPTNKAASPARTPSAATARFAGSLGTQVVKVFDLIAARTGLRDHEAQAADRGWTPASTTATPDDHKAYYPGATPITIRITGDTRTGRLLGAQLIGHRSAEIAKRVDIYATALFHDMTVDAISELDLSYTPPLGSPWDAVQIATQAWTRHHHSSTPTSEPPGRRPESHRPPPTDPDVSLSAHPARAVQFSGISTAAPSA